MARRDSDRQKRCFGADRAPRAARSRDRHGSRCRPYRSHRASSQDCGSRPDAVPEYYVLSLSRCKCGGGPESRLRREYHPGSFAQTSGPEHPRPIDPDWSFRLQVDQANIKSAHVPAGSVCAPRDTRSGAVSLFPSRSDRGREFPALCRDRDCLRSTSTTAAPRSSRRS